MMIKSRPVIFVLAIFLLFSCDLFNSGDTGMLVFKGVQNLPPQITAKRSELSTVLIPGENTHTMYSRDMKFNVYEIYISEELVDTGLSDLFQWYKIGENNGLKSVHEYEMQADDLPPGTYKSLKIIFRNEVLRYAVYINDTANVVLMPSSLGESDSGDSSFVINYFSAKGSFMHSDAGFELMSSGENIQGFRINAGRTTTLYWMGGSPDATWSDFTFTWHDMDEDSLWSPGVDFVNNFEGPEGVPMWTFMAIEE
ncbi:MAG: hypothetical protein PHT46_03700 [Candidatus Marinimicrobia bacterium]|nr:hypothetical protein [Candidatus Neomarinimicrobiota bacterium]MDD5710314.1 hypothetical protein [Candidatus Neomarinimicrobiota bacterium]